MGLKSLAEGIILQSLSDLWSKEHQKESLYFFNGKGFSIYADLAGMNTYDRLRLYNLVNEIIKRERIVVDEKKKDSEPMVVQCAT